MVDVYESTTDDQEFPPVTELSAIQRRVLGTLIEKGLTTPDQYPLTVKAATSGCNQKSNRDPVVNYREDDVLRVLDELREMGLVAVVLTGGGRTERYRHYVRKRFPFSEPQIAIMAELWLRGRQQLGELRTRASRMVPVESLDDLRAELESLLAGGYIQANGDLARRGIEVDHAFYRASEGKQLEQMAEVSSVSDTPAVPVARTSAPASGSSDLQNQLERLQDQHRELKDQVSVLEDTVTDLMDQLQQLKRDLGV